MSRSRVVLAFHSLAHDGHTSPQYTDNQGCAYFQKDPGSDITVFADGKQIHRGRVSSKEVYFL